MFQANDFDDEHWTAKEKYFYPQEIRKRSAVFRDTWRLWRILTNEACGGFRQECCSEQPAGCRKFDQ